MAIIVAACAAYGFQILTEKNGGESVNDINVLLYVSAQAVAEPPVFVIERRCRRHAVGEVNSTPLSSSSEDYCIDISLISAQSSSDFVYGISGVKDNCWTQVSGRGMLWQTISPVPIDLNRGGVPLFGVHVAFPAGVVVQCKIVPKELSYAGRRLRISYGGLWSNAAGEVIPDSESVSASLENRQITLSMLPFVRCSLERLVSDSGGSLRVSGGIDDPQLTDPYGKVDDTVRFLGLPSGGVHASVKSLLNLYWDDSQSLQSRDVLIAIIGILSGLATALLIEWIKTICN